MVWGRKRQSIRRKSVRYVYGIVRVFSTGASILEKVCLDKRRANAIVYNLNYGIENKTREAYKVQEIPFDQLEFCNEDCCKGRKL